MFTLFVGPVDNPHGIHLPGSSVDEYTIIIKFATRPGHLIDQLLYLNRGIASKHDGCRDKQQRKCD